MMYQAILSMPPFMAFMDIDDIKPVIEIPLISRLTVNTDDEMVTPDNPTTAHRLVFDFAYRMDDQKIFYRFRKLE